MGTPGYLIASVFIRFPACWLAGVCDMKMGPPRFICELVRTLWVARSFGAGWQPGWQPAADC
jgi:hypothetical protein